MNDGLTQNILRTHEGFGNPPPVFIWQRCSQIGSGPPHYRYTLRMGRSLELTEDGNLTARSLIAVGHPSMGGDNHLWQSQPHSAPVGTVEAERMLQVTAAELKDQLSVGLELFVNNL